MRTFGFCNSLLSAFPWLTYLLVSVVLMTGCHCGDGANGDLDPGDDAGVLDAGPDATADPDADTDVLDAGPDATGEPDVDVDADASEADPDASETDLDASDTDPDAHADASDPDVDADDAGTDADVWEEPDPSGIPVANGAFEIPEQGLFGGPVLTVDRSVSAPDVIYGGTDGAGISRSDDGGENWTSTGIDAGTVPSIAVNPSDSDRLWAYHYPRKVAVGFSVDRQLVHSTDGGVSFEEIDLPEEINAFDFAISEDAVWIAGGNGVYRSLDDGDTWESTVAETVSPTRIEAHPTDPDVAWHLGFAGIWRTDDGGDSFTEVTPQLEDNEYLRSLSVAPSSPDRLWLGVSNGKPARSDDGGDTWSRLNNTPSQSHLVRAAVEDEDTLWVEDHGHASGTDLWRSDDGGSSWDEVAIPAGIEGAGSSGRRPMLAPRNADEALAYSRSHEVRITADGGDTWQRSVEGLMAVWVRSADISDDGSRIVLGSDHGELFISDDEGMSFDRLELNMKKLAVAAVAIDPTDDDIIFISRGEGSGSGLGLGSAAGYDSRIHKSIDGGETFSPVTDLENNGTPKITALWAGYDGEVFVETPTGTYRSTDQGMTWERLDPLTDATITDLDKAPEPAQTVLAGIVPDGQDDYFAVSEDLGDSWTTIEEGGDLVEIDRTELSLSSRVDPEIYYASTGVDFGKYNGDTWASAQVGLTNENGGTAKLAALDTGALDGEDLLLGVEFSAADDETSDWSIYVSENGAQSWSSIRLGYKGIPSTVVVADEKAELAVIGLEAGRGLLVTRSGGTQP